MDSPERPLWSDYGTIEELAEKTIWRCQKSPGLKPFDFMPLFVGLKPHAPSVS
jgi:hypothetical protein